MKLYWIKNNNDRVLGKFPLRKIPRENRSLEKLSPANDPPEDYPQENSTTPENYHPCNFGHSFISNCMFMEIVSISKIYFHSIYSFDYK